MTSPPSCEIYLIRHGETAWSLSGQHTGLTDIPLSAKGEEEARALRVRLADLSFDRVLCSPLMRVQKTCELSGLLERAEMDKDLVEWDYGDFEGMTTLQIRSQKPSWRLFEDGAPGGESLEDVKKRADRLLKKAMDGDVKRVAIYSSGHFSRVLAARYLKQSVSFGAHLVLSTASLSILGFERESRVIRLWNDTAHLKIAT